MQKSVAAFVIALSGASAAWCSLAGSPQDTPGRRSTDPPLPARGKLGQDLFLAVMHRDVPGTRMLLDKGADPNARNGLEFTPLYIAAASHQLDTMRVLLAAGADKDAKTTYGTPLGLAAMGGFVEGAELLLSLGVNPDDPRTDGMTPLSLAAGAGATPIVTDLIARKVDLNARDDGGLTALAQAVRCGNLDTAQALAAAGADVNLDDSLGETPLMHAAMTGRADLAQMLLGHGAHPNATDNLGRTALFLSASYGDFPDVIRTLVKGGAKPGIKDSQGRLAARIAARRGYLGAAAVLNGTERELGTESTPRSAISRSLALIQSSTQFFCGEAKCVSCHQEGLGRIATAEAASRGFRLDPQLQATETARIGGVVAAMRPLHEQALKDPEAMKHLPLIEMNEVSDTYGWLMAGMAAQGQPRTEGTAAMAMCLAKQQAPDGSWTFSLPRVPMQSSFFTFTALAVHALEAYGPQTHRSEIEGRIARARDWLLKAQARTSEDRATRLLGLKWAKADSGALHEAAREVLADQRTDGGWSQLPTQHSDAYATGQALYALHVGGGVPTSAPAWRKGCRFLLRTQDDRGAWFVNKRANPANNYFSMGFPYGESQYASFNGTCWAMMALLQTLDR